MKESYKAYRPSKWEDRVDKAISVVAPQWHHRRVVARERTNYFRYLSAYATSARTNTPPSATGETMRGAREKIQVMWNAINLIDNSGLCSNLLAKFGMYICGTLRWQSRCGDKAISQEYEDYMRIKCGRGLDVTNRYSLRQMCLLDIRGIALKGDIGCNIVREGSDLFLQGIEAERIGNPYEYIITNNYVRGLRLDDTGIVQAADIYYRDRMSAVFTFDQTIPMRDPRGMPRFLFMVNPISYDDYRGVSMFKSAIETSTYIDRMREYELQALMWAASQSGVYHTKSGALPEALPFDSIAPLIDPSGNRIDTYQVRPNTVTAIGAGEDVSMFQHDRPSPNVLGMVKDTIRDICTGFGVSYEFGWDMSGLSGPAVRGVSAQDARAFEVWQNLLQESKLDPVAGLILGNGIANKEIPFHPNWDRWQWFFPAKSTIDIGRESAANIEEIDAGINSAANVAAENSMDVGEIITQRGLETAAKIETAKAVAKEAGDGVPWMIVYNYMYPPRTRGGFGSVGGALPMPSASLDGQGATTGGTDIGADEGDQTQTGEERYRLRMTADGLEIWLKKKADEEWYRPDQDRDEKGRFADEGKGSLEPGYKSPAGEKANITTDNIEQHRGDVKSDELAKHKDNIEGAFNKTLDTKIVPTYTLVSNKNEMLDPKFVAGEKPDSRQTATNRMLAAINEGGPKRDPINVRDNMDGTFTIKDGNATSQAAMLAGWSKLPVHVTESAPEPEMSPIEKALVDYKPGERPLNDPATQQRISDVLHNARFVPYDKTPFFQGVNEMMGVPDPTKVTGEEYKKARDDFFNQLRVKNVPMDQLVVTQRNVNKDKIAGLLAKDPNATGVLGSAIQAVRYKGETFDLNGHHRAVSRALLGKKDIDANLLDLGDQDLKPDEIKAFASAAKARPQLNAMAQEIATANGGRLEPTELKGMARARAKVNASVAAGGYAGDWSQIKDIARTRITAADPQHLEAMAANIRNEHPDWREKATKDPVSGYTDYKFYPKIEGGEREMSVMTAATHAATSDTHGSYEEIQSIERNANNEGRKLTAPELEQIKTLNDKMRQRFQAGVG